MNFDESIGERLFQDLDRSRAVFSRVFDMSSRVPRLSPGLAFFLLAAAVPGYGQELRKLRQEFKNAVVARDATRISSLGQQIAGFNDKQAADILIWGYDYYAQLLDSLWRKRQALQLKQEGYEDFMIEYRRLLAEQEERRKKGVPNDPAWVKKIEDFNKRVEDYQQSKEDLKKVETEINEINSLKEVIVGAMAGIKSDTAVEQMIKDLKRSSNWTTRAAIAEALGKIDHPQALPALRERLEKEREPGAQVAIIDALAEKGQWDRQTVLAVAAQLKSSYWQVQYAAAMALKASKSPDAIEPLIHALETAEGRLKHDIHDALTALTGVDKGLDAKAWMTWFNTNRDKILAGAYKPLEHEKAGAGGPGKKTEVKFYGIPVKSRSVIFVLDRSGSMAEPGAFNEEEDQLQATGGDSKISSALKNLKPAGNRKIDIAKYQLKKVLYLLPKGTKFNIIFYNHQYRIMSSKMLRLNDSTRRQAFAFFEPLEPEGQTDIWQALSKAFELCAEPGPDGRPKRDGADTIYLLSDGLPFPPDKVVNADEILTRVRDWNRLRKIVIHTIFVSAEGTSDYEKGVKFMEQLAKENWGIFKAPKQPAPPKK